MYDGGSALLDQFAFFHGPRDLLARYVAVADAEMRTRGVRLRISADFPRLIALNKQHRASWPLLSPIFNPDYNDLGGGKAFMIEGVDESGETVVSSAGRLYDHGTRSLADDLRSLRVFYDDAAPHRAAGESVTVTAPSAEHFHGRVMFSGAVWVRPDYRRHGVTRIVPRLTRGYALTQWNTPLFWAYIDHDLDEGGVTRAYGSWVVEDGIATHMPSWRGDHRVLFLSMGQATLIRDIAGSVAGTTSLRQASRGGSTSTSDRGRSANAMA